MGMLLKWRFDNIKSTTLQSVPAKQWWHVSIMHLSKLWNYITLNVSVKLTCILCSFYTLCVKFPQGSKWPVSSIFRPSLPLTQRWMYIVVYIIVGRCMVSNNTALDRRFYTEIFPVGRMWPTIIVAYFLWDSMLWWAVTDVIVLIPNKLHQ